MEKHFDPKDMLDGPEVPNQNDVEQKQRQEEMRQQQEEMKSMILGQILTQEARERLNNIKLVKPEKAKALEETLIRMAQTQQLSSRVDDEQLKQMLGSMSGEKKGPTIKIQRKRFNDSDDDEDW